MKDTGQRKRIAVFASGNGSNFQAISDYAIKNDINGDIVMVFSDKKDAFVLKRAEAAGVKTYFLNLQDFKSREEFDREISEILSKENIDLICLAGYLLLLSREFIEKYSGRIINVHPSILPSFKGIHGIKDAFDYGVKITGATIHFVEFELDAGPIIFQKSLEVKEGYSLEKLESEIHKIEHEIYPKAVELFCKDRIKVVGRKVKII